MDAHIDHLKSVCRMFGSKVVICKGYHNPKLMADYKEVIQTVFELSVMDEESTIYPKVFCKLCHMKLYRLKGHVFSLC